MPTERRKMPPQPITTIMFMKVLQDNGDLCWATEYSEGSNEYEIIGVLETEVLRLKHAIISSQWEDTTQEEDEEE